MWQQVTNDTRTDLYRAGRSALMLYAKLFVRALYRIEYKVFYNWQPLGQ